MPAAHGCGALDTEVQAPLGPPPPGPSLRDAAPGLLGQVASSRGRKGTGGEGMFEFL